MSRNKMIWGEFCTDGHNKMQNSRFFMKIRLKWEYLLNPEHIYINRGKL